ncbi:unnamed protein product [Meloidogyne enterolobii]|uniref:Uncharacterized protein n=1 Tax=Meloidogyne enterolobii TaxID=390850 RepID=A0ACB0ZIS6_MELEN
MNEADRRKFTSFAHAQLTVANEICEYMGCPLVFFCPTGLLCFYILDIEEWKDLDFLSFFIFSFFLNFSEYCESSASPTLDESGYLTVLGAELHPDIRILWTGIHISF